MSGASKTFGRLTDFTKSLNKNVSKLFCYAKLNTGKTNDSASNICILYLN